MKILINPLAFILLALGGTSLQRAIAEDSYLLKTQWYQTGPYARFTPNQDRLGCWSTAYAQILYYHRLKPTGRVTYDCSSGQKIDLNLDQYQFDWNLFANEISANTPQKTSEQVAHYCFATASVVRKDSGSSNYSRRSLSSVLDIGAHFAVDAEIYVYLIENPPIPIEVLAARTRNEGVSNVVNKAQIVTLLTTELDAHRPVYFYFANLKEFGHATVIDGLRRQGDRYMVHINFGDVALARNRWYDLFAPIEVKDDHVCRAFVTIKPVVKKVKTGAS